MMFNDCKPRQAIEEFVGDDYIQHHPLVASGKEPFIALFEGFAKTSPNKHAEVKRAVAEGDLVVLHVKQVWPGEKDYAGMDFFRFDDNGKIVEHWDVLQIIPEKSANDNTMFWVNTTHFVPILLSFAFIEHK